MTAPYVIPNTRPQWNDELESELCMAIAEVLQRHGFKFSDKDESIGWTGEMAAELMEHLQRQTRQIRLA